MKIEKIKHSEYLSGQNAWKEMRDGSSKIIKVSCGDECIILEAVEVYNHSDRGLAVYRPEIRICHDA